MHRYDPAHAAIRRKIAAMREMTVARGCTLEEAATAQRLADELEASLHPPRVRPAPEPAWTPPGARTGADRWADIERSRRGRERPKPPAPKPAAKPRATVKVAPKPPKVWTAVIDRLPPELVGAKFTKVGRTEYRGMLLHRVIVHGGPWNGREILVSGRFV